MSLRDLWTPERLELIEADLHDVYGLNLADPRVRASLSWRTFCVRVAGLLNRPEPTRLRLDLRPPEADTA